MKVRHSKGPGAKDAIDLIEEAINLVRQASCEGICFYYVGTLPFILGLLYFWADMSRSAFASERLPGAALGLSLLFFWMKGCQALFAGKLVKVLNGQTTHPITLANVGRLWLFQTIVQPSGLFLIPVSIILPFAWVYAFYQNATALAISEPADLNELIRRARKQAAVWPAQNHLLLAILLLFAFLVFLNVASAAFAFPHLLRTLLGIESAFTQTPWALGNSTVLAAIVGVTYLCVDPLIKAVYVLRCFYGESIQSGEDLKVELRQFRSNFKSTGALILLGLMFIRSELEAAAPNSPLPRKESTVSGLSRDQLDKSIEDTINKPEYSWRMPREGRPKPANALVAAIVRLVERVSQWWRSVATWMRELLEWIFRQHREPSQGQAGTRWMGAMTWIVILLAVSLACMIGVLIYRMLARRSKIADVVPESLIPVVDLNNEDVAADQLPEDGWLKLAAELVEKGDFRLAVRAYYLAGLAHLARQNLITLARFKSNHEYEEELQRRGHAIGDIVPMFNQVVLVFDRVWYGLKGVNRELVEQFARNIERMRTAT